MQPKVPSDDTLDANPDILDAKPPDSAAIWKDCEEASNHVSNPDGSTNWRAAFSADPGMCSCPACGQYHWNIGHWHRCRRCKFIYPTDAWAMFSWGRGAARWASEGGANEGSRRLAERRMKHPYFKLGYESWAQTQDAEAWALYHAADWPTLMQGVVPDFTVGEIY